MPIDTRTILEDRIMQSEKKTYQRPELVARGEIANATQETSGINTEVALPKLPTDGMSI